MNDQLKDALFIGGEYVKGNGEPFSVQNPADESQLLSLAPASAEQVDAAVAAAYEAKTVWVETAAGERCELLHAVARWLRNHQEDIATLMTREGGKPLVENRDEIEWTAAAFDFYAELGRSSMGRVIPPVETSQLALVVKEPMGVVASIVPWNYPLLLLAWKIAPALAAGNTVVCKPSELTPLATLHFAQAFADFPAGVVNIIAGDGAVGDRLVRDERVDCVAFTGSVATGKKIGHICVDRVARINLELGGKDPFIVCPDILDQIEVAAKGGAWAAFLNSGQVCTSAERFYVHDSVYDDFLNAITNYTTSLTIGDPLDETTDIGPMASAIQRQKVQTQVEAAVAQGAQLVTGGHPVGERGYFYSPAIITGAASETDLLREETFGPVAPIVRVKSLDEAIKLANSTPFGLGANVYTKDLETITRCMRELKAGTLWFNDPLTDNDAGPFGGFKQSGLGRELGEEGLDAFRETKHVHIETRVEEKSWWYPYRSDSV